MAVAKKITINDVAQAAGVSVSTVSLVLSGKGRISSATGQRVNDAVEQLGFVRNRQASALRGGQSGVIGLIVRDLTSPFYAELTAGLTEALESQGRMVFLLHGGREADHLLQRLDMLRPHDPGGRWGDRCRGIRVKQRTMRTGSPEGCSAGVCFPRQLSG